MRILLFIFCSLCILKTNAQNSIGAIGTWREHYNNANIQQAIKGDQFYLASKNQIIVYNENTGRGDYFWYVGGGSQSSTNGRSRY